MSLALGVEIAPLLHTKSVTNLQDGSLSPNLLIGYGGESLKLIASIGTLSRFGFSSSDKWTYASAYYTFNTKNSEVIEHGAEMELGFNYRFGECKDIKFHIGSSIGLLMQGRKSKLTLRPLVIGFTYNIPL